MIRIENSDVPLNIQLFDKAAHGPMSVRWEKELAAGGYELQLDLAPAVWRRDFIVRVDHRPVCVRSAYFNCEGVSEQPPYVFRFIVTEPGVHWIDVDLGVFTFADCEQLLRDFEGGERPKEGTGETAGPPRPSMTIRAMRLERCAMPGHGMAAGFPYHQQLWGWMPCSKYQRHFNRTMTRAYFERRIVDESAKWGSNYLQLHSLITEGYLADGDVRDALPYAHAWGFLLDEHGGWLNMDPDKTVAQYDERMEAHFAAFLDRTELSAPRALDGWESEDYNFKYPKHKPLETFERVLSSDHRTWRYHPGSFISQCRSLSPYHRELYLSRLHEGFHGPNYGKVLMCAGAYTGNGYDDLMPLEPFPHNWAVKSRYNWVYRVAQADCRVYSNNKYSSGAMLDWATKQHWDFFRLNAEAQRDGRLPVMSGLTWLGEPNLTLPEDMREGVLAASLEPCRSAICYPLTTTGRDGLLYWRYPKGDIRHLKESAGSGEAALELRRDRERRYTPRDLTPGASWRIHNGVLAATQSALGGKTELAWDTEELGQFDVNAPALKLSADLFTTGLAQPQPAAHRLTLSASGEGSVAQQVELDAGSYMLVARADKAAPFRAEVWLMQQYLGSFEGGELRMPFCAAESGAHTLELRAVHGSAPEATVEIVPTHLVVETLAQIGSFADATKACVLLGNEGAGGLPLHAEAELGAADAAKNCPKVLDAACAEGPRAVSLWFDAPAGTYLLTVRARTTQDVQRLDVGLNAHLFSDGTKHVHRPLGFGTNDWVNEPGQYGRAGAWMLDGEWRTYQMAVAVNHRGGKMRHKLELSTPAGEGRIEFASIRLSHTPVRHWTNQVGGHEAKLEAESTLATGGMRTRERRTLRMVAGEPSLFFGLHREVTGGSAELASCIDLHAYDEIRVDGQVLGKGESLEGTPRWIEAADSKGLFPPLNLAVLDGGAIDRAERTAGGLRLLSRVDKSEYLFIAATLRQGAQETLAKLLRTEPSAVELGPSGTTLTPMWECEEIRLVRVKNPAKGPYFVREEGWWRVRGAQPLRTSAEDWEAYLDAHDAWIGEGDPDTIPEPPYGDDLVRVQVRTGDEPAVQPFGFIDGCVRPGWGSQKQMLLGGVSASGCTVRVLSVTPYIFAPRVEFAGTFTSATLDGNPWAYHDGRHVFLPQHPGDYRIEVDRQGARTPSLLTTAASVERAEFADGSLRLELGLPAYVFKTPGELRYHVLIGFDAERMGIGRVEGGEVLRQGPEGTVIRCDEMQLRIEFG